MMSLIGKVVPIIVIMIMLCMYFVTVASTLSPWELWLLRKTEDERKRTEKERQQKVG